MHKRIAHDVHWMSQCIDDGEKHMHLAQYLVRGEGNRSVLIDTGAEFRRGNAIGALKDCLGGGHLEAVLLTHSTLPHTENLKQISDEWPDAEIISATNNPTVTGLRNYATDTKPKVLNEAREIAGLTFSFLDPLLTDIVASNWVYCHESKTLFTAEGLGNYHRDGECRRTSSELKGGIPFEHLHAFNRDKLPYLKYVDPEKLRAGVETVFDTFDVECIAPIHGNVVSEGDIDGYLERSIRSVTRLSEGWSEPSLRAPPD